MRRWNSEEVPTQEEQKGVLEGVWFNGLRCDRVGRHVTRLRECCASDTIPCTLLTNNLRKSLPILVLMLVIKFHTLEVALSI